MRRPRPLLRALGFAVLALGASLAAWAFVVEPRLLRLHREALRVPGLPAFTVAMISDVHAGGWAVGEGMLARVVDLVDAARPDFVVLLGDLVEPALGIDPMSPEDLAAHLAPLGRARPVYAVLGNHDHWFDGPRVRRALEAHGIRVLDNEAARLTISGGPLWLIGLADLHAQMPHLNRAARLVPPGEPAIALIHEPDFFPWVPPSIPLLLAGHSHGGQVRIPFLGRPIVPSVHGERYAAGHVEERGRHLFVTTGIGTSDLPVRFGVPPEVAVLDVNR